MNDNGQKPQFDKTATMQLAGALLRGFLFGDEAAVDGMGQTQVGGPPTPVPPPAAPEPSNTPVSGLRIVQETHSVIAIARPAFFEATPRLDLIQQAFECFNRIGLSATDTSLMLAAIRASCIRYGQVPPEAFDYSADVALEVVDAIESEQAENAAR